MAIIPLPNKIKWEEISPKQAKFIVEPCNAGFGTTLGNALRRVLLSSLSGAAVTKVKIKKVDHEFSTIPGVKEDVMQIILNLKNLRLKSVSDEPVNINLQVKNKIGQVKASDITKNSDIEIIDKDFVIATLTDKKAELDMDMTVEIGLGYVPIEERKNEDKEVGSISLDAFYSPVINVGFEVERARIGQDINYDRLVLDVTTDGSISPREAVGKSIAILLEHYNFLKDQVGEETTSEATKTKKKIKKVESEEEKDEVETTSENE